MSDEHTPALAPLALRIAVFVALGTPLVAYVWETLNRLMAGRVEPVRLLVAVPALLLLLGLFQVLARAIGRWEGAREDAADHPSRSGGAA